MNEAVEQTWEPREARGYKWPDFVEGNDAATKHGIHASDSKLDADPRSMEIEASLLESAPWLSSPTFADALTALRRTLTRLARAAAYIEEHGEIDSKGRVRPVAEFMTRLERLARDQRTDLGLTPSSAARLSRNVLGAHRDRASLDDLMAQGRRARLKAEARMADEAAQGRPDGVEPASDGRPTDDTETDRSA